MAFWGVEVKPGKPVTHHCERARGRLRISQATLGIGEAHPECEGKVKIVVQCNVGNRSPVFLCALLTNKTESCHLDVEFEEADDVVFSVLGPRSVYLTGYYVQRIRQLDPHSDTESYGVDIENTQTEGSSYCSDDEKYDDSFIDDDDDELKVSPQSPVINNKGMDEATLENDKSRDKQGHGRQRKKKYQMIESDSDANSNESEDEKLSKSAVETTMSDAGERIPQVTVEMGDGAKDDGMCSIEAKEKVDQLDINGKPEGVTKLPLDEEKTEVRHEKNELPKAVETLEETIVSNEKVLTGDRIHENKAKDTIVNQSFPTSNENDQMQSIDLFNPEISAKSKNKRKLRSKKEKARNILTDNTDHSVLGEDKEHEVEASTNTDIGASSDDGQKSKKRRNELQLEGTNIEGIDEKCQNMLKDDKFEQGMLDAYSLARDLPVANQDNQEQQRLEKICTENIGTEYNHMPKEDESVQVLPHADSIMEDLSAESEENQEKEIDNKITEELRASNSQPKKKIKKKKKTQGERDLNMGTANMADGNKTAPMEYEDQTENAAPVLKRTLSNGLIIEKLASGPPNGKVAAPGKKVKINCTGMLKEGGHVFDTETAFKFRLGDEEFIDGWNVGIDGMHVGDKRRLIIPPSMGFGDQGMGENVPPNSWLVYDVELIGVRK